MIGATLLIQSILDCDCEDCEGSHPFMIISMRSGMGWLPTGRPWTSCSTIAQPKKPITPTHTGRKRCQAPNCRFVVSTYTSTSRSWQGRVAPPIEKVPGTDLPICCEHLYVDIEVLAGKGRAPKIVKMREFIGMVGVERFGVKVSELADVLGKSRDGVELLDATGRGAPGDGFKFRRCCKTVGVRRQRRALRA